MSLKLGLDLGSNSIGWAIIDDKGNRIIDAGVRIFQEGVNRETSGKEVSKNATRREARQKRKNFFRTRIRKEMLKKVLTEHCLCPSEENALKDWFKINPYQSRAEATEKQITLFEIGRILYLFAQHRGFKSNRIAGEDEGKIFKGDPKAGKTGINETYDKAANYDTLGKYLYEISHKKFEPYKTKERIRNRYTTRAMYEDEFSIIWAKQQEYYPEILTEELKTRIGDPKTGILFYSRPLRVQKFLIGKCTFEPKKTKCPLSSIDFELFRTYQFINTIEYGDGAKLNDSQREQLAGFINSKSKETEFFEIKKKLGMLSEQFNYEDNHKIFFNKTIFSLNKLFGPERWSTFSEKQKEDIWHILYSADSNEWLVNYGKEKWGLDNKKAEELSKIRLKTGYSSLSRKAVKNILPFLKAGLVYSDAVLMGGILNAIGKEKWSNCSEEERKFIIDNSLAIASGKRKEGETIALIREFLKENLKTTETDLKKLYHHSQDTEEKEISSKLELPPNLRNPIVQQALFELRKLVNKVIEKYGTPDEIKIELARDLKISKKERENKRYDNLKREDKNDEVRRILDEYGLSHSRDNIHKYLLWEESKHTCPYTGNQVSIEELFNNNKYQIEHIYPYSITLDDSFGNKTICEAKENQLKNKRTPFQFYGGNQGHWEEVKARAKSLLPFRKYMRFINEKELIFDEFIQRQLNDTRYISREAASYLKNVCKKITVTPGTVTSELRHFWGLNSILGTAVRVEGIADGHYFAAVDKNNKIVELTKWSYDNRKTAPKLLEKKGEVVYGYISNGLFIPQKQRENHLHHAIDAIAVACTTQGMVKQLADWNKYERRYELNEFPLPWDSFFVEVKNTIEKSLVSFATNKKATARIIKKIKKEGKTYNSKGIAARGPLHNESVYGIHAGSDKQNYYHIRKPLESINKAAQVEKIADPAIKQLVKDRLQELGINVNEGKYEVPANAFFEYNKETGERIPLIYLPNKRGDKVPVRKVRMKEVIGNAVQLKKSTGVNQWVNPMNNYMVAIYKSADNKYTEKIITLWEAVERKNSKLPLADTMLADGSLLHCTLMINELFIIGLKDEQIKETENDPGKLSPYLYRVQKLSSMYYTFRHHLATNLDNPLDELRIVSFKNWDQQNPVKADVDLLGKIRLNGGS